MRIRLLVPLFSLFLVLCGSAPASAATGPGDLIKLQDDGNPDTTADSAVYYVGTDGKRYAFPNAQVYFTWYADFDAVKIVSATEMASYQLGGNVTYRPGTRLVKITSDPHVYAVEPGGLLRWVQTEQVASGLYGADWNKRIDDIPDAFFFNYSIGEPLAAPVYPSGTIVKRTTDNVLFRIEDRTKRKIASAAVASALRVQDAFVLATAANLAEYPDGPDINAAEPAITDTAQKSLVAIPSIPTFTAKPPATSYFAVGNDATLLELHLASLKAVTVTRLTVKLDATTNNPADANLDDDKGGLVYQDNAQPNFTLLRFKDQQGGEPFGRKDLALDVHLDQSQTFTFDGSFSVPANTEKILYFVAKTNTLLPTGEGYKVTLVVSGTDVRDASTGTAAAFAPSADLVGPTLTSLNAAMEVTSSPSVPGSKTYVRGAVGADIAGLQFKATTVAPNVITSVTWQGYVDEEGTGGFLPGADADNGSETRVRDMLPNVSLYDGTTGTKVAGPVPVSLEGKAAFTGMSYAIPAGQTAVLVVRGDISKTIDLENSPNRVSFDVVDASVDVTATDDKGAKVNVRGANPDGGVTPTFFATIKKNGTIGWSWTGNGGSVVAGREAFLGTLSADVKDDAYDLKSLTFRQSGGAAKSLGSVRLEYPTTGAATASATQTFLGGSVTFANLPIVLPKDKRTDLKLYGSVISRDAGAVNGEQLRILYDTAGSTQFISKSDGTSFDSQAFGTTDFAMGTNSPSSSVVRFTDLTFAQAPIASGGTVYRSGAAEVFRFTVKAGAEGPARIRKLTFKVSPSDAGKAGSNNDALERWADVNGDFPDDDGIVNLKLVTQSNAIIGEDSSTHIMYSVVHGGAKNTEPSTIDSANGDYGLIEYAFSDGSELTVPAGVTYTFSLELDVSKLDAASDYAMGVDLLGGADLQWTDVPSGAYAPLSGTDAFGLPFAAQVTVKQ